MHGVTIFDEHAQDYDRWFEENERLYQAEVDALRKFVPLTGVGVEIGVGTGRFAAPFGIQIGIEPARRMGQIAQSRGISVCQALGERLPFSDDQFDFALLVTVICFVRDVPLLLRETRRVLRMGGRIIIGFIDKNSTLGQSYELRKSKFYQEARFYSVPQITDWVKQLGFGKIQFCQTVFGLPSEMSKLKQLRDGYGEGAFIVLSADKTQL